MDPYILSRISRISRTFARETESHSRTLARVEKCEKSATLIVSYCCSMTKEVIDFDEGTFGGPGGGAGALFFLWVLTGPMAVDVLIAGDVGRSPGVAQPDPELILSPAL